jgi:hypothetical protein
LGPSSLKMPRATFREKSFTPPHIAAVLFAKRINNKFHLLFPLLFIYRELVYGFR